jgi:RNA polymerase sigma-70 factor (ECF subfamily)
VDELTALAATAARGDDAALAALVRQTYRDVWRLCAHLVEPSAADDLVQETYARAIPALRRFRGDAPVRTWLLAIARRACAAEISARSRDRRLAARLHGLPPGMPAPEPGSQVNPALLLAAVEPGRRAAFVLTQLLGCSYAEAAVVCGCPVGTIRSRVARAREDLDAMLTADAAASRPGRAEPASGTGC